MKCACYNVVHISEYMLIKSHVTYKLSHHDYQEHTSTKHSDCFIGGIGRVCFFDLLFAISVM